MLYRPVLNGEEYNHLFGISNCEPNYLAKGNTKVALKEMKKWTVKYAHQSEKIANKLNKGDLKKTVDAIHSFVYNHFQYSIDENDQLLRSPSCAWQMHRYSGIDCKSYSIISATILLCLGIKCYFRRIQQSDRPGAYTHVYVVIPKNQKTGRLKRNSVFNEDYYIIDGTIKNNKEVGFIKKDDIFMNEPKLNIIGLAQPSLGCTCDSNLQLSSQAYGPQSLGFFNFNDVGNIISNVFGATDCIGGSAYSKSKAEDDQRRIISYFNSSISDINEALANQDAQAFNEAVNNFKGVSIMVTRVAWQKIHDGYNSCTEARLMDMEKLSDFYRVDVWGAMESWLNTYFDSEPDGTIVFNSTILDTYWFGWVRPVNKRTVEIKKYTIKSGVTQIPAFEITGEIPLPGSNKNFDVNSFLNSLSNVALEIFDNNSSQTVGSENNYNSNENNNDEQSLLPANNNNNKSQASFGGPLIFGVLAIAAGTYIYQNRNKK